MSQTIFLRFSLSNSRDCADRSSARNCPTGKVTLLAERLVFVVLSARALHQTSVEDAMATVKLLSDDELSPEARAVFDGHSQDAAVGLRQQLLAARWRMIRKPCAGPGRASRR